MSNPWTKISRNERELSLVHSRFQQRSNDRCAQVQGTCTYMFILVRGLKGKFSSGREGALASKFNYDFK